MFIDVIKIPMTQRKIIAYLILFMLWIKLYITANYLDYQNVKHKGLAHFYTVGILL